MFTGLPQRHVKTMSENTELRKKSACGGGNGERVGMKGVLPESEDSDLILIVTP